MQRAVAEAARRLVERRALVELIGLAAVAGEHVLVLGPPGTAKSEAVRRVARCLGGRYFEYLLGRFTEPSELFGPIDLRKLREGRVETETAGMLPEAEIAFLDEVFLGSTAILNTLLGLLNERQFRRGHTQLPVPLRVCVGAANHLPEAEELRAFSDRFLVRYFADPVADPMLEDLLEAGWSGGAAPDGQEASMMAIDVLADHARSMQLDTVRPHLAEALRRLRKEGIELSDRRAVRAQRLIAAAAALAGRQRPTTADLWPLVFAVPERDEQEQAREVLKGVLSLSENQVLPHAAEHASAGPAARAERLAQAGVELMEAPGPRDAAWQLRVEGILREIDAGFAEEQRPSRLISIRARLADAVAAGWKEGGGA